MNSETDPKDHPKILFKYCHPDRVDILEGLKIRFTQPACFNDIFEAIPGAPPPMDMEEYGMKQACRTGQVIARHPEWTRFQRREFEREELKKYRKRFAHEKEKSSGERICEEFQIRYSAVTGALCVSGTGDNILMWSHYCQDHTGFAIEFDGMHEFFDGVVQIEYSDIRPVLQLSPQGRGDPAVFHTKSTDWKYEDEFRKFANFGKEVPLENGNKSVEFPPLSEIDQNNWPLYLIDLPPESIRRVILGHRISTATKNRIFKALKSDALKHVECTQALPHPTLFKMEHRKIEKRVV